LLSSSIRIKKEFEVFKELTTLKPKKIIMKKVLFLGMAAIFSLAVLVTSCSDDDDKTCIDCTDGDEELEYCYEEGNVVDAAIKWSKFFEEHPNAVCNDADLEL